MRSLGEYICVKFKDPNTQFMFEKEIKHAFTSLFEEMGPVLTDPLKNDVNILKEKLCKYIEFNGRLGYIRLNLDQWLKMALHERENYHRLHRDRNAITEAEIRKMALDDCQALVELSVFPDVLMKSIKENKAMARTIIGHEMEGLG